VRQRHRQLAGAEVAMAARVVCISRTLAASGEGIARAVAEQLGYRVIDAEIIQRAAEKAGVDPRRVHEAEQRQPLLRRLFASFRSPGASGDRAYQEETALSEAAAASGEATQARLRALIRDAIGEIAAEGRVVIIAHAASMALGGREDVLRVLVTASPDTRARRLVQLSQVSLGEARDAVGQSDRARSDYFRHFYRIGQELPTHYDIVVNTDVLAPEQAIGLIVAAATG
jgi:cytidylate kinase